LATKTNMVRKTSCKSKSWLRLNGWRRRNKAMCGRVILRGEIVNSWGFTIYTNLRWKYFRSKIHVSSELKGVSNKHQKKAFKKLVKANKGGTFAPATTQPFFNKLTRISNQDRKFIFKKDLQKLVRLENGCYICTPQNKQSSLIDW